MISRKQQRLNELQMERELKREESEKITISPPRIAIPDTRKSSNTSVVRLSNRSAKFTPKVLRKFSTKGIFSSISYYFNSKFCS